MQRLLLEMMVLSLGATISPQAALAQDDGAEFAAKIAVKAQNPLVAVVSFSPTIAMHGVRVEVPNDAAGSKTACSFGEVIAGKAYSCQVLGQADDVTNGLVVALIGMLGSGKDQLMVRKTFTVPNPSFNANKLRGIEGAAQMKKGRLQQGGAATK